MLFGRSAWFELERFLSLMLSVIWTVPGWPAKIRRHMATLATLGRVRACVCVSSVVQREVVSQLGAWEK